MVFFTTRAAAAFREDLHVKDAALGSAGELAPSFHGGDLVLAHEEFQALGVLGHNLVFALLDGLPVQFGLVDAFNPKFFGLLEMVPDFRVEEQRLGGDAAHVQAGAAQDIGFFDEASLQPPLAGADGGGVPRGAGADDGNVIDGFWQVGTP